MKRLPLNATDGMIVDAIKEFVGFLVEERYSEASDFLFYPLMHDNGDWYSVPERIESGIHSYLYDGERLTSIEQATGEHHEYGTCRVNDEVTGTAWFALPINGEWSDLMVLFRIWMVEDSLVFCLEDIRVP